MNEWLRGPLRPMVADVFTGAELRARSHFRQEKIDRLYQDHVAGRADKGYPLWNLMVLELWIRQFVDGRTARCYSPTLRRKSSIASS